MPGLINVAAFAVPAPFTFGNSGCNILLGPGSVNFDFPVYKYIAIVERVRLQFRSEFFNVFNHPNFGNPASDIAVPANGRADPLSCFQMKRADTR